MYGRIIEGCHVIVMSIVLVLVFILRIWKTDSSCVGFSKMGIEDEHRKAHGDHGARKKMAPRGIGSSFSTISSEEKLKPSTVDSDHSSRRSGPRKSK